MISYFSEFLEFFPCNTITSKRVLEFVLLFFLSSSETLESLGYLRGDTDGVCYLLWGVVLLLVVDFSLMIGAGLYCFTIVDYTLDIFKMLLFVMVQSSSKVHRRAVSLYQISKIINFVSHKIH